MRKLYRTLGIGLVAMSAACAEPPEPGGGEPVDPTLATEIEASLREFNANPADFMDRLPVKTNASGLALFSSETVASRGYIKAKNLYRKDSRADAPSSFDLAKDLVDALPLTRAADMTIYRTASLPESPWSDDYWALYTGSLGKRYADTSISYTTDWKANTDKVRNSTSTNVDTFSPAEKYDLLVGDTTKALTKHNLDAGKPYYDDSGKVETWMGICHGWSPAAFMMKRPLKTITVKASDGRSIKFHPSDIKALASSLWAEGSPSTRFIGGRCDVMNPQKDAIGRIKDPACRDTNAGTWHLAVVNQIARNKRSFVLDATYDYEVWNQPVYGYDFVYFHPVTNATSTSITTAKVAVSSFPADKFKAYRAAGTTHIVGVSMNVKWVVETNPSTFSPDSPSRDAISGARYLYTLELDSAGAIIGGEWMQNAHPDFLWTPPADEQATSGYEAGATGTWDGVSSLPASWKSAALKASADGIPLQTIVQRLIDLSRQ